MKPLIEQITDIIKPVVENLGLELFDLSFKREGKNKILRIVIDKLNGSVSVDDCRNVSILSDKALDIDNTIPDKYFLEVTSPGIDRPLRDFRDFNKFTGKLIKFQTVLLINGRRNFIGRVQEAHQDYVIIKISDNGEMKFRYNEITKAHLELEF